MPGPYLLTQKDLAAGAKAGAKHGEKIYQTAAYRHGGQPHAAHIVPHHRHIHQVIDGLQQIGEHKGDGEEQQLFGDAALGKIIDECFGLAGHNDRSLNG